MQDVLDRLFARRTFGVKLGLDTELALLDALENPHESLAVVHVAHRADSALYVERKREACARVGIDDWSVDLPPAISQVRPDALCLQP